MTNKTKEAREHKKLLEYEQHLAESKQAMSNSKSHFMLKQPFYGTLLCQLPAVPDIETKTMSTDGKKIFYSPSFVVKKLNTQTTRGVTLHELFHVIFCHATRRNHREPKRWNIACDYAINPIVVKAGYALPRDALIDAKYYDLSADAIYNLLPEDLSDIKMPKWGLVDDSPDQDYAATENKITVAVNQAAEIAYQKGNVPGEMTGLIKEIKKPLVDWRTVLYPFVMNINDNDYSWSKPNRAYISEDEYFPSLRDEATGSLAVIVDTSGSCVDAFPQFWGEICALHQDTKPEKVILIQCDYSIQGEPIEYTRDDVMAKVDIEMKGYGGTSFVPPFELINEKYSQDIVAAVYLTDLEGDFPDEPHYPVLWVSTNKNQAPWGTTVYMNPELKR